MKPFPVINIWLSPKEAARKLSLSTDTITRRGIPFIDGQGPVPYKIRFKLLQLDEGGAEERRYAEGDCEAMLHTPVPRSRGVELVPTFT